MISDFDFTLSRFVDKNNERCESMHSVFGVATEMTNPELWIDIKALKDKYIQIEYVFLKHTNFYPSSMLITGNKNDYCKTLNRRTRFSIFQSSSQDTFLLGGFTVNTMVKCLLL